MICENCGKEHNGIYASGRFCSSFCAHAYVTKFDNSKEQKIAKCINCGKEILVNKRTDIKKCRCQECKKNYASPSKIITCKICGNTYIKNGNGECKNKFCQKHNISQFKTLIKYFGFNEKKLGTCEVENEFNRIRKILYKLYWEENLSSSQIGKKFKYKNSHNIVQQIFKYLNIPPRTVKQSVINTYLTNSRETIKVTPGYKDGWHTTWNNKEVYLRSSYELDYAKELDKQKINYDVENLRIKYWDSQKQEYRCAIPDFYIPKENLIIEIKSSWTTNYQELKDKEYEYKNKGYNYKLIFEHQEYTSIDDVDLSKYRINDNKVNININRIYEQKDGYKWIYKDNIQKRCNKKDIDNYLNEGWKIGRLCYKKRL